MSDLPNRRTFLAAGLTAISTASLPLLAQDGTAAAGGVGPDAIDDAGGIYALQTSLRFDQLRFAAYDPKTESLTLLGDRWSDRWLAPIPYLDHLAAAWDGNYPSFTLPWDDDAARQVDALMRAGQDNNAELWDQIVTNARGRLFNPKNRLTKEGLRILRTLNFPADGYESFLTNKFDVIGKTFQICGGEQQATVVGAYGRSLRDPNELNEAIRELAMSRALDATMTGLDNTDLWETFIERFAGVFDLKPTVPIGVFRDRLRQGEHLILARNAAVEQIVASIEPTWAKVFPDSLELSAAGKSHIHLPPDLVRSLANTDILVKPTWNRIAPESRMAEVMFDADLLLKWVVADPMFLAGEIPSYLTEYNWNRTRGDVGSKSTADKVRFWISPDVAELVESSDGGVLEFGKLAMKVNTDDPGSEPYASYLTSLYDDLARVFPTLHELRECAKMVMVAQWLRKKSVQFTLPAEGRDSWEPPDRILGFITIDAQVEVQRKDSETDTRITGKWTSQVHFEGGVSLALDEATRPDGTVLFDGAKGPRYTLGRVTPTISGAGEAVRLDDINRVAVPQIYDNPTLREVLRQKTIPPPPLVPGATAKATLGQRKLDYLRVLRGRLGNRANSVEMQRQMQQAIQLAEKLKFNDEMLNSLQAGRINSLAAFQKAEEWARDEREQFLYDLLDIGTGGLSTLLGEHEVLKFRAGMAEHFVDPGKRNFRHWLLITNDYLPKIKTLLADASTAQQSVRSHEHFDRNLAFATKGVELLAEVSKALEVLKETQVTKRIPGYAGLIADTTKAGIKIADIQSNLREIESLSSITGDQAQFIQRLQDRREAYLTELRKVIESLEPTGAG